MTPESNECFITVWAEKDFKGPSLRIDGPGEYPELGLSNYGWSDCISSLRVGPKAFVLAYEDHDFGGRMISFGPNQEVSDLSEMSFNDKIDSLRVIDSLKLLDHTTSESDVEAAVTAAAQPIKSRRTHKRSRRSRR